MNEYEKFDSVPDECLSSPDRLPKIILACVLVLIALGVLFL